MILLLFQACNNEEGCTEIDLVSRVNAGFYVRDAIGERDTIISSLTFFGVQRPDSLIADLARAQKISFPLPHQVEGNTKFIISDAAYIDTITIWHIPAYSLVSYSCGFTTVHTLERIDFGTDLIDTIAIESEYINRSENENLKIYIKPLITPVGTER